jgi:hypothetical protein
MTASAILPDGQYCPACGYDQRGLASGRCPECGIAIDKTRSSVILWERRKTVGYVNAFFRTLIVASINPKRIARATSSPVDVQSARLFRRLVILLTVTPILVVFFLSVWQQKGTVFLSTFDDSSIGSTIGSYFDSSGEPALLWSAGATFWPVLPVAVLLLLMVTTAISHWFYVGKLDLLRQNRAMAVSNYLCAPLIWLFVPLIFPMVILLATPRDTRQLPSALQSFAFEGSLYAVITLGLITLALLNNLRLLRLATQCGIGRWLFGSLGILFQWLFAVVLSIAIFPALVGLCWLMFDSLRSK